MSRGLPDSEAGAPPYVPLIDTIRELQVFLVERYLPGATLDDVRESVRRLAAAADTDTDTGTGTGTGTDTGTGTGTVRHLCSTLVPEEGAVFALFLADSIEAVVSLNRLAGLPIHHLVAGVHLTGRPTAQIEGPP